ncbi:hypothetical protein RB653_002040 [Dictyostelium firmibasis]|uniref:Uncharacterized protein n=1 Tax=Dictyostelium firmibasis TaxID=79012 RepID=A0AAN7YVB5_9MYCE
MLYHKTYEQNYFTALYAQFKIGEFYDIFIDGNKTPIPFVGESESMMLNNFEFQNGSLEFVLLEDLDFIKTCNNICLLISIKPKSNSTSPYLLRESDFYRNINDIPDYIYHLGKAVTLVDTGINTILA